jgi:hypothetical protein
MKKILLVFLLTLASTTYAEKFESNKLVVCEDLDIIVKVLKEELGEDPVWQGTDLDNGTGYIFFINATAKTWSFVQHNGRVACVLGVGNDGAPNYDTAI